MTSTPRGSALRIRYTKHGKVRFTSHRDVARIWERALRRSGAPVAHSEGFSPRPRLAFGLALPTGYESDAEYLDVELVPERAGEVDPDELAPRLTAALPAGMAVTAVARIDRRGTSLQASVASCTWWIDLDADPHLVEGAVARALAADSIVVTRERKGREVVDDLRPQVIDLEPCEPMVTGTGLRAELATQPRAVRPSELIGALDAALDEVRVRRLAQWIIDDDGTRREPLPVPCPSSAPGGSA